MFYQMTHGLSDSLVKKKMYVFLFENLVEVTYDFGESFIITLRIAILWTIINEFTIISKE